MGIELFKSSIITAGNPLDCLLLAAPSFSGTPPFRTQRIYQLNANAAANPAIATIRAAAMRTLLGQQLNY